eukprot:TRINITY_DN1280_c0_g2_i1.p1 TRINITY_DN1280_c0_g2~~TRINITY_DN1280_c0_g2_i1.p1  ORF type:complete len:461 (+),score=47.89 TRINITY_DN1280_c0_g2_i1:80-1462(+)
MRNSIRYVVFFSAFVLIYFLSQDLLYLFGSNQSSKSYVTENYHFWKRTKLVELDSIVSKTPSKENKKYYIIACTVMRNEYRATEWVIRNALAGIQHFIIFNDYRPGDINSTVPLMPLVELGLVTIINDVSIVDQTLGYNSIYMFDKAYTKCNDKYGYLADWMVFLHADEILWVENRRSEEDNITDIHQLPLWLDKLDQTQVSVIDTQTNKSTTGPLCGVWIPWSGHFPESYIKTPSGTFFENYPYICDDYSGIGKTIFKPQKTSRVDIHTVDCIDFPGVTNGGVEAFFKHPSFNVKLSHYPLKSIGDYLISLSHSFQEYPRYLSHYYQKTCFKTKPLKFYKPSRKYKELVLLWVEEVRKFHEDHQVLDPVYKVPEYFSEEEKNLFTFLLHKVKSNLSFDADGYLLHNPIDISIYWNGLDHFLQTGYKSNATITCWINPKIVGKQCFYGTQMEGTLQESHF